MAKVTKKITRNIYAEITEKVLEVLRTSSRPWVQPWNEQKSAFGGLPYNVISKKAYSGVNTILLWMACSAEGWNNPAFLTFKQAQSLGGSVVKGAKSTPVVYMNFIEKKDDNGVERKIPFLKLFHVFNVAQCENLPEDLFKKPEPKFRNQDGRIEEADEFVRHTLIEVREGQKAAAYYPEHDFIGMPAFQDFKDADAFYATLFHELGHASGSKKRLNRDQSGRFGSHNYSYEELVAELCSSFISAEFGIDNTDQSGAYIKNWIRMLESEERAFFSAAAAANKAANYLRNKAMSEVPTEDGMTMEGTVTEMKMAA